jgi:hypothetical protein
MTNGIGGRARKFVYEESRKAGKLGMFRVREGFRGQARIGLDTDFFPKQSQGHCQMSTGKSIADEERIVYLNIAFSPKGVAEYAGKRCVVFIPRDDIRRIECKTGSRADRPLVQSIAGTVLCGLGLLGLRFYINAGLAFLRWEAGFVVFGGLGTWLLWEVFDKGRYLLVDSSKGNRKLVFAGKIDPAELDEFMRNAARLGYNFP